MEPMALHANRGAPSWLRLPMTFSSSLDETKDMGGGGGWGVHGWVGMGVGVAWVRVREDWASRDAMLEGAGRQL